MPTTGILTGDWLAYVAADATALTDAEYDGAPGSSWTSLGLTKKGEGIKLTLSRSQENVEAEGVLNPIDLITAGEQMDIEAMLIQITPANIAQTLFGDQSSARVTPVAASASREGTTDVSLSEVLRLPHQALLLYGADAGPEYDGQTAYAMRAYFPRVAILGDWDLTLMMSPNATIPARFRRLHHPTINPSFSIQTAPTS